MDNFVFSEQLELSIVEHRLTNLLEQLLSIGIEIFFPAILFNESFWRLSLEKRLSILRNNQIDWVGDNPANSTFFYVDEFYLELIKSIKVSSFSFTKVTLPILIDTLKTKNKFSITDYQSFGETINNNLLFFNDLLLKNSEEKPNSQKAILGKLIAVKYASKFSGVTKPKSLVLCYDFDEIFWNNFLASILKIAEEQNKNFVKNSEFFFGFLTETALKKFEKKLTENKELQTELENLNYKYDVVNFVDLKLKEKFDFILLDSCLSVLPTNILIQFGNSYYEAKNRLTYIDRVDEKKAIEQIAELTSPSKDKQIDPNNISNISIEITWEKFNNENLLNLVNSVVNIPERNYFRISVSILKILVELIKNLKKDGLIEIFDTNDFGQVTNGLGVFTDEEGINRFPVDFELYRLILDSFTDISTQSSLKSINQILSEEIYNNQEKFITVLDLMKFLTQNVEKGKELLNIENFTFKEKLRKLTKPLSVYEFLAKKNISLLGIPSALYSFGLSQFIIKMKSDAEYSEIIKTVGFTKQGANEYEKEFMTNYLLFVIKKFGENKALFLTKNKDHKQNEEITKFIKELKFDENKFFEYIAKYWDEIVNTSEKLPNFYQSFEIVNS